MNSKNIRYILSLVLMCEAAGMTLPLICSVIYGEYDMVGIWIGTIALCFVSALILSIKTKTRKTMYARDGFVSVALSWVVMSLFGAIPFVISKTIPNFIDALFETVSGFTTTGASVISNLDIVPKSLIFWRSFTHWIGGMGVLVFLVALIPSNSSGSFHLIKAESPGPSVSKLVPKTKSTAKILYLIYIVMTLTQIVLLLFGGMKLFDAVTLSFGTAGTGGFSIDNAGFGQYSSYCQIVITVFMVLFGVDFSIYHLLIMRKFRDALKSEELRAYFGIIITSIILISINCVSYYSNLFENIKHSAFQVSSIMTTTGYTTQDFDLWPTFSKTILVILMFFGACAGSTGGGIKISRILIMLKSIVKEIKIMLHPKSVSKVKLNGRVVEHGTVRAINVFMVSYFAIFFVSVLLISIDNFGFTTNFTAVAATINNIGPGLEAVGPTCNFSIYSPLSTLVLIMNMLIGRLEIFPIMLMFYAGTWKKP